ncbi:unnamed protein product [Lactuca virosa]|uniref:Uncharacterized protein n=1 Tax=Lactuca virosa TaxID=75947 RepID=A0AAU9P2A6_9ASTR|nr:unnamed protein product [Lactuca virosa]
MRIHPQHKHKHKDRASVYRHKYSLQMASLLDFFNCFSETSPSGKFVCDGDVCVLRKDRSVGSGASVKLKKNQKQQRSLRIPFVRREASQNAN